jgi:TonB family protein
MDTLLHLLRANIAFILLYGIYHLFFRRVPHFAANRAWLLWTPVAAFVLPSVSLPASVSMPDLVELPPPALAASVHVPLHATSSPGPEQWLAWTYLGGVFLSVVILVVRYVMAWRASRKPGNDALSFFGRILIPADAQGDEERALLAHERVHAAKGHSLDVLYYELLAAASWLNPLWRVALRELRTVHELQADAVARAFHPDYVHLLLSRALGVPSSTLLNSFRSSNLKTRITMLNKTASRFSVLKYTIALPVLLVALVAVSCIKQDAPPAPATAPSQQSGTSSQPIMDLSQLDVQPEFPGGMDAMSEFLLLNIHYPEQASRDKVEGKVFVQFTVGTDGKVQDVGVRRGPRPDLNDEAVRAVASMPNWVPGQKDGHAVATRFTVPVSFTLEMSEAPGRDQ